MKPSLPLNELYAKLESLGWKLKGPLDQKNGLYVAKGEGPGGQVIPIARSTAEQAIYALIQFANNSNAIRMNASRKHAAWQTSFTDQMQQIGEAYAKLPVLDPKAVPAWRALADESKKQADAIRAQIKVTVTDNPEPYPNVQAMVQDIHHNKNFLVSRAHSEHPVWNVDQNVNFRIVHDVLGHGTSGGDFGWVGENAACGAHFPLITPLAREALFTECIGQTAYVGVYHGFGPQKVAFMSDFLHPAQANEGEHVSVPHGGAPTIQAPSNVMDSAEAYGWELNPESGEWDQTDPEGAQTQLTPSHVSVRVAAKLVSPNLPVDPNRDWEPNVDAETLTAGHPSDYIDMMGTMNNAEKLNTNWWDKPTEVQDQAILNAFRVAILSPRKHLRWNAAHAQALMHLPPSSKAVDMWDRLEQEREHHNRRLGHPEGSHLSYRLEREYLAHTLQERDPGLTEAESMEKAKEVIFAAQKDFERQIEADDDDLSEMRRQLLAKKMVTQWLQETYAPPKGWMQGQMALASDGWEKESWFRHKDPEADTQRLEWENGMVNDWPQNYDPMAEGLCPHCGRARQQGSDFCPICQNSYNETPTPATQTQYGVHPSQWPDSYVEPKFKKMMDLYRAHDSVPGNGAAFYYPKKDKEQYEETAKPLNQLVDPRIAQWALGKAGITDVDPNTVSIGRLISMLGADTSQKLFPDQNWKIKQRVPQAYDPDAFQEGRLVSRPAQAPQLPRFTGKAAADEWSTEPLFHMPAEQTGDSTGFSREDAKYGAFMGAHLDAVAEVGSHINDIRKAALDDISHDEGRGYTFRNRVMNMNLKGVNPKVCSFAWLLLRPTTSELGIIDTHAMRALTGEGGDKSPSVKDYYKLERMQRAARDASGYRHMPQGLYHWGLWDVVRNPGHHSDHSPLRVLHPQDWDDPSIEWDPATSNRDTFVAPPEFEGTRPLMDQVAAEFDDEFGDQAHARVPDITAPRLRKLEPMTDQPLTVPVSPHAPKKIVL